MTNSVIDLHLHTYYSDGSASPAEILRAAANLGLKVTSITDHDNINAYPEALHIAPRLGLEIIPGIELTTYWKVPEGSGLEPIESLDIDIMGYCFDLENENLNRYCQLALIDLRDRIKDACELLTQAGYPVSIFDVQDVNNHYTGARQLIEALVLKGYANWNECVGLFNSVWPKVRSCRSSIECGIDIIHQAGGVAVLAHPIAIKCSAGWLKAGHFKQLAQFGLDGLEINHPRLDPAARAHFLAFAHEFDLIITGGSDEHGGNGFFTRLGCEVVRYDTIYSMQSRAHRYTDFLHPGFTINNKSA